MKIPIFIIAICLTLAIPIYLADNIMNSEIVSVESYKAVYIGMASDTPIVSSDKLNKHYLLNKENFPDDFNFDSKNTIVRLEISKRKAPYYLKFIFTDDIFSLHSDFNIAFN